MLDLALQEVDLALLSRGDLPVPMIVGRDLLSKRSELTNCRCGEALESGMDQLQIILVRPGALCRREAGDDVSIAVARIRSRRCFEAGHVHVFAIAGQAYGVGIPAGRDQSLNAGSAGCAVQTDDCNIIHICVRDVERTAVRGHGDAVGIVTRELLPPGRDEAGGRAYCHILCFGVSGGVDDGDAIGLVFGNIQLALIRRKSHFIRLAGHFDAMNQCGSTRDIHDINFAIANAGYKCGAASLDRNPERILAAGHAGGVGGILNTGTQIQFDRSTPIR